MHTYYTTTGENLSSIIFAYYGKINTVLLRDVLAANQNLADIPTVFPPNTEIVLPDISEDTDIPVATLWD